MVQTRYKVFNVVVLGLVLAIACGLQSSFWFQITGGAPAPQLWILIFAYISLYRPYFFAMLLIDGLTVVMKPFSAVPLGLLWTSLFVVVSLAGYVRVRFFWSNTRYFIMSSAVFCLLFNICFVIFSHVIEENPTSLSLFTRFLELTLTTLFSAPMYWLLLRLDRWTMPEVMEQGARP